MKCFNTYWFKICSLQTRYREHVSNLMDGSVNVSPKFTNWVLRLIEKKQPQSGRNWTHDFVSFVRCLNQQSRISWCVPRCHMHASNSLGRNDPNARVQVMEFLLKKYILKPTLSSLMNYKTKSLKATLFHYFWTHWSYSWNFRPPGFSRRIANFFVSNPVLLKKFSKFLFEFATFMIFIEIWFATFCDRFGKIR